MPIRVRAAHMRRRPMTARRAVAQTGPVEVRVERAAPSWLIRLAGAVGVVVGLLFSYGLGVIS